MTTNLEFLKRKYTVRLACDVNVEQAELEGSRVLHVDGTNEVWSHQKVGYVGAEYD